MSSAESRRPRTRFLRGLSIAAVLAGTLIGSATTATSALAAPSAKGEAGAELLTTYLTKIMSPESPSDCVPAKLAMVLPDRKEQLVAGVPCSSKAVIPPAIRVADGFENQSGGAFVAKVSELSGVGSSEAAKAIAEAAGVPVAKVSTMTVGELAKSMLLAHADITDVTDGGAGSDGSGVAEKTTWTGPNGQSGILTREQSALVWGAIGASVGAGAGGAVGAAVGAVVGAVLGWIFG